MTLIQIALLMIVGGLVLNAFVLRRFFNKVLSILKIEEPSLAPLFVRPAKRVDNRMYKRTRSLRGGG